MYKNTSEVEKFFEGLPSQDKQLQNVFDEKAPEQGEKKVEEVKSEQDETESEGRKNRRHRRLEEQLQRERESNIALNERLKVLAEFDKVKKEVSGEADPRLIDIFGTTPEAIKVAKHFTDILKETEESAKAKALEEISSREQGFNEETKQYESLIDSELEALEDQYNVDLTSDTKAAEKARREFLGLVEALSPKDEDGSIKDYADFASAFEIYQSQQKSDIPDNSRNKEVASRSMQRSAQNGGNTAQHITPGFRGWEKDYGL